MMNKHATNLRRTRADMLGTDDEDHYWECHRAAAEIERLEAKVAKLEAENRKWREWFNEWQDDMTWQAAADALRNIRNRAISKGARHEHT